MSSINSPITNKIRKPVSSYLFNILSYGFVAIIALCCLFPFLLLISGSFTSDQSIRLHGYSLFIQDFSTESYQYIFRDPSQIIKAYGVSIFITAVGTCCGLLLITMTAFVLSRQDFKYRNVFSFYFYFTTLFNGGMICTYIFYIRYLHLKNNILALILPGMLSVFYILIMRGFIKGIPAALIESAKIDGAGEFRIFFQIILPLSGSGLATIGLFMALTYWNDWYNCMLYITDENMFPLQYLLYNMLQQTQALSQVAGDLGISVADLPTNSLKMAMTIVAIGPIILLYPFVQRFFVKGVTIGAVKG